MNTQKIDQLGGKITFDDVSHLNQTKEPSQLIDDLKEDFISSQLPLGSNFRYRLVPGIL
jgi:hypothetical protein